MEISLLQLTLWKENDLIVLNILIYRDTKTLPFPILDNITVGEGQIQFELAGMTL